MKTLENYLQMAKKLEGKKVKDSIDSLYNYHGQEDIFGTKFKTHRKLTKGVFARFIEEDYFGLQINSRAEADFVDADLELKVTGIKHVPQNDLYNAKERLVLSMINYEELCRYENWTDNIHLFNKLNNILLVIYLYEKKPVEFEDFKVIHSFVWSPTQKQKKIIQHDYNIIRNKVLNGEIISERHTNFLANCPKHAGGYNKANPSLSKPQSIDKRHPYLDFAERRAFCIKNRILDQLIADSLGLELRKIGASVGLFKKDYPNFMD